MAVYHIISSITAYNAYKSKLRELHKKK